ncbi:flagellar biosynthetic protein FliR [Pinisolibacter aquiterrae]|uniref:flagellar biosynthetic protein FliR n=1 Tax=Pinisolibacter aquiterrae TaxID=2815579 RepID=UPI001C3D33DB|nr:flagellar biosynthetic protein FliR [Pinisolibacter aquiterrae]MBV5265331.1 flagellar type III secretion system protein FliR [Pinisolibacter aquiterrae]MCC8235342.1 flagellar type III secretion system protein FliR [Pinisolibacter aquiterrae]
MVLHLLPEVALLFMLAFARLGAMVMLAPGFGETTVPVRVRLVFAFFLTLALYPIVAGLYPAGLSKSLPAAATMLAGELIIGLFLGMATRLLLAGAQVAGATIATQLGLGFAMTVDPTQGQQGVIVGNFLSLTAVTLIFVMDLHLVAIGAMTSSFQMFPPGGWIPSGDFAQVTVQMVAESFKVGVQISAPFLAFGLVFNLGLGMLQKMMPQFQIYFAAMPASIGLGLLLFGLVLASLLAWYMDHVRDGLMRLVAG